MKGLTSLAIAAAIGVLIFLAWQRPPAAQLLLEDYTSRLERSLETNISVDGLAPARLLAPLEERRRDLPESRTSLGKALSLGTCGLVPELARVNNSLGKVASDSERLLQTQRILALANTCEPDSESMKQPLEQLIEHRQQIWPLLLSNTLVAGDEWSAHFKASTPALAPDAELSNALDQLLGWMDQQQSDQPNRPERLIELLDLIRTQPQGAAALNAQRLIQHYLPPLTQSLRDNELCSGPRTTEQRRLINQVFKSQYLERVQPWLSTVERALRPINEVDQILLRKTNYAPQWLETQYRLDDFQTLTRAHALAWRDLLTRCGVQPGAPSSS